MFLGQPWVVDCSKKKIFMGKVVTPIMLSTSNCKINVDFEIHRTTQSGDFR